MRIGFFVACGLVALVLGWKMTHRGESSNESTSKTSTVTRSTSRAELDATIESNRQKVAANPGDGGAAVQLADALMRAARVKGDAALAIEAEHVLRATLQHSSSDYLARRMLSVVYLSQHRFAEALTEATAAQALRPKDAWNYAIAGDALLELGRYEEAFDSFDQVMEHRPDAGAYARVAYARELQGDLDGAVRLMRMSAEATSRQDLEGLAWTHAQIGNLYVLNGQLDEAEREFDHAEFIFPSHPYAMNGRVRLLIARHRYADALDLSRRVPTTPETLATQGDLLTRLGHLDDAEKLYREAERVEREGWKQEQPQPGALARFLAERGRNIPEAIALAERAAAERQDVVTMDALAWSYFRGGRVADAATAIQRATRLGTVDPRIRCHASAIATSQREAVAAPGAMSCDLLNPQG
ncbi:MAG TPA: tetratricopeptide repeat protein [Vicinamibacterales bacterium]|nr:tetratricopeptide repeat protein [Vicinamibacterales bacterium]